MKLALAQINSTIGDFPGNAQKILDAYRRGAQAGADLVVTPELALCGYPPRDLILRDSFLRQNEVLVQRLAEATGTTGLLVGYVGRPSKRPGRPATNAVALLQNGHCLAARTKTLLPTYDVFDEDRYFEPAEENSPVAFSGRKIGLTICEDVWNDADFLRERRYPRHPARELAAAGAELIFNLSASPWHLGKNRIRQVLLAKLAAASKCPLVYCNMVGGNDELIFDGASFVLNAQGHLLAQGGLFAEDHLLVDTESPRIPAPADPVDEEKIFNALVLGVRDYLHKCGFQKAVLGLSGGIDSAVTAAIAAAALGPENVHGISLPSRYSSPGSLDDARQLAANLGLRYDVIPIEPLYAACSQQLQPLFVGRPEDVTEENIQARLRAVLLMGVSNKFGSLLLTTGNKSELAVGYCTLYGDMCGGLAVISDVPKTMVYRLARWINRDREMIPSPSLTKPPSAELRPDQKDQDSLPPYDRLDAILEDYVVQGRSPEEMIASGHLGKNVEQVVRLIDRSEYKRRQAAPGLKVTSKAFGMGRRIPIAQRFL